MGSYAQNSVPNGLCVCALLLLNQHTDDDDDDDGDDRSLLSQPTKANPRAEGGRSALLLLPAVLSIADDEACLVYAYVCAARMFRL